MKLLRHIFSITLVFLASAVLASAVPGRAEVKKIVGNAKVTNSSGATSALAVGMALGSGDTVITGPGSMVHLWLGVNGDDLTVDADTTLKLDQLDIANVNERQVTTSLTLAKGSVLGDVKTKLTAASKYEIKTASGVAGIRGTIYTVAVDGAGRITKIIVLTGTVSFIDRGVVVTITSTEAKNAVAYVPSAAGAPVNTATRPATHEEKVAVGMLGALGRQDALLGVGKAAVVDTGNPLSVSVNQAP
jgi:hypothetical protein